MVGRSGYFKGSVFFGDSCDCVDEFSITNVNRKSCQNCVSLWKPGLINDDIEAITKSNENVTHIHDFEIPDSELWYIRLDLDYSRKVSLVILNSVVCSISYRCSLWSRF